MTDTDLKSRLAGLSPEQRALLFKTLHKDQAGGGERARAAAGGDAIAAVPRDQDDYPPSFAQQRLWFLYEYEPDSAEYNIPQGFRLRGALDRELLARALEAVTARHEVMRTSFRDVESEPRQVIAAARAGGAADRGRFRKRRPARRGAAAGPATTPSGRST